MSTFSIILIIATILANTVNKIYTKIVLNNIDSFTTLFISNIFAAVIALPILVYNWELTVNLTLYNWLFIIFTCICWALNGYLGNLSVEKSPVSIREPLSQLQIIFAVLIGVFIFKESLALQQIIGIGFIIIAGLVLVLKKEIFNAEVTKQSLLLIFSYTFFTAIVASFDKHIMSFTSPSVYMFFNFSIPTLTLCLFLNRDKKDKIISTLKNRNSLLSMIFITFTFFASFYLTLWCYKNFDFSIIYPIIKIATPITAVLGIVLLGEKKHWQRKIVAVALATIGAIICKISF